MGCGGHKLAVSPEDAKVFMNRFREKHGTNALVMVVKDQNMPGKVNFCGDMSKELLDAIVGLLKKDSGNKEATVEADKYDGMYEVTIRNTNITSGAQMLSMAKAYFPRGKLLVSILDTIAQHGWTLGATPNFGGLVAKDDKGNVTQTVDWPTFVFYRDVGESPYTAEHLMFAIKDSNMPGKVCAAGPVGDLESTMAAALQRLTPDVKSEKDSYDDDYDVVWRNTSITTGGLNFGSKNYYPKGFQTRTLVEQAYAKGWRLMAGPNFGGDGDSWPCFIFRRWKDISAPPPDVLLISLKDANVPGKLCITGNEAQQVADAFVETLRPLSGQESVKIAKDEYDIYDDLVVHNVNITCGYAFLQGGYFPRADSMKAFMRVLQQRGYSAVACPNFGGMASSWPTWVMHKDPAVTDMLFLSIKDEHDPGAVNLAWNGDDPMTQMCADIYEVLKTLCGQQVTKEKDPDDANYNVSFRKTKVTTGHSTFTMTKPYYPHGYVVEGILQVLRSHGFQAVAGPNFGNDGSSWPTIMFQKVP